MRALVGGRGRCQCINLAQAMLFLAPLFSPRTLALVQIVQIVHVGGAAASQSYLICDRSSFSYPSLVSFLLLREARCHTQGRAQAREEGGGSGRVAASTRPDPIRSDPTRPDPTRPFACSLSTCRSPRRLFFPSPSPLCFPPEMARLAAALRQPPSLLLLLLLLLLLGLASATAGVVSVDDNDGSADDLGQEWLE